MTSQATPDFNALLSDAHTATAAAEQKARNWQGVADRQRAEIDRLTRERDELKNTILVNAGGPTDGPWWVERPANADAYIAYGVRGDLSSTYDLMEAYNVDTDYELMASAPVLQADLATITQLVRDLVASLHGDGNGRCWCGAREADRLRGYLERKEAGDGV